MFPSEKAAPILALLFGAVLLALPRVSGAAALESVKVGFGSISGNQAPLWIAKEARLFEKQGLDVELVYIPGGEIDAGNPCAQPARGPERRSPPLRGDEVYDRA